MNHDAEQIREFYRQFIRPSDLVFDVGANVGDRTRIFAQLAREVIAVEPQMNLLDGLKTHPRVHVVEKACGAKPDAVLMYISPALTISTMSSDWMQAVASTKRFELGNWTSTQIVPVTTLQDLIRQYGKPEFCKIDVEGYEFEVLEGMHESIQTLSFEFTPEYFDSTWRCVTYLMQQADKVANRMYEFNFDLNESFSMNQDWLPGLKLLAALEKIRKQDGQVFGDVYARLI